MIDRAIFNDTCVQRANVIEWLPFEEGQFVLVNCDVPSAVIEMLKHKKVQLQILGDVQIEKLALNPGRGNLDYILLLGMKINSKLLTGLYNKLKPSGRLVVLLHNTFGMSYFSGKPAYGEQFFVAIEGKHQNAENKSSFYSLKGINKLFEQAGIAKFQRYYLDPDSDFTVNIFSDEYLPRSGDCNIRRNNFTYDRLRMFDESVAYHQAIQEEMYPVFANDFLLVTGEPLPQVMVRYSNDRAEKYQIKTEILKRKSEKGALGSGSEFELEVRKTPLYQVGKDHVQEMVQTYQTLCDQYSDDVFSIVPCEWKDGYVVFPFVEGVTLAEYMKQALQKGDKEKLFEWFHMFVNKLNQGKKFGFANYDFIFHNIVIQDNQWQVIDYEWTVKEEVPAWELAFRAAYCFSLENKDFPFENICQLLHLNQTQIQQLIEKETAYQRSITGSHESLESLCAEYGGNVYDCQTLLRANELSVGEQRIQIYEDRGNGFSEEHSYWIENGMTRCDEMDFLLMIDNDIKAIRIDPGNESCLLQIKRILWNGQTQYLDKQIQINGTKGKAEKNSYPEYIFAGEDPNFTIKLEKLAKQSGSKNELRLCLEFHKISCQLANTLAKNRKRLF